MLKANSVKKSRGMKEGGGLAATLMMAPSVIFLAVCSFYPFMWIFRYICYNYNGFKATYTGARNLPACSAILPSGIPSAIPSSMQS